MDIAEFIREFGLGITALVVFALFIWKGVWPFIVTEIWPFIVKQIDLLQSRPEEQRHQFLESLKIRDEKFTESMTEKDIRIQSLADTWTRVLSERDKMFLDRLASFEMAVNELTKTLKKDRRNVR